MEALQEGRGGSGCPCRSQKMESLGAEGSLKEESALEPSFSGGEGGRMGALQKRGFI